MAASAKRAELLAPAGSWESMVAAVQSGADAVYMGAGAFNARRSAKNFDDETFPRAVAYCHLRGVKVYLTLNTLVTDRELPECARIARMASDAGVDAILVQDWGVLSMLKKAVPDVPLHASTQMSLFTLGGVEEAARLGMERAVLAREMSREEIAHICREASIEIETFLHGALCMCYSGQCAMSALIGSRSGNRGRCAQPCRLPYSVDGKEKGHPLSLKDSCLADYAVEMSDMGVACLKLEGRMKRAEYVAVITDIYARILRENRRPTAKEHRDLAEAFSRSGFTDGYYQGKKGPHMFGTRPENTPEPTALFAAARALYEKEDRRTVPVRFTLSVKRGEAITLTACDDLDHTVTVSAPPPEEARNRAVTAEDLCQRLQKTGGTVFTAVECAADVAEGLSVSASVINALRREALSQLEAQRTAPPVRRFLPYTAPAKGKNGSAAPRLTCSVMEGKQMTKALCDQLPAIVYFPLEKLHEMPLSLAHGETELCALLPRVWKDGDEAQLIALLKEAKAMGVRSCGAGNIGHLSLARAAELPVRADFGMNVFNSGSMQFLKDEGLLSATVSFELRREQIRDLQKPIAAEAIVYGRLPLMIMENCVICNSVGCSCKDGPHYLTDRTGERFPLLSAFGCRNEIENAHVLYLGDKVSDFTSLGLSYARLRFTTESGEECAAIFRGYTEGNAQPPKNMTRGLFYRGVE
ncbi:MAG: U32 family peptidase [Oscillospiraceae bacterium]|nr:U32 family peptidase [Oscillospiraceae bacterium]